MDLIAHWIIFADLLNLCELNSLLLPFSLSQLERQEGYLFKGSRLA